MKIDTSRIENFDSMTSEEKIEAMLNYEAEDETDKKYKELISKANSEAKKYKDQAREAENKLKSQMSAEEQARLEEKERYEAMEQENARLKRDFAVAKKTDFYKSLGFSEELATETAEAFADGNFDIVEQNHLKAHSDFEKNIRADVVKNAPRPNGGGEPARLTKKDIMAIKNSAERQKMIAENIDLFS